MDATAGRLRNDRRKWMMLAMLGVAGMIGPGLAQSKVFAISGQYDSAIAPGAGPVAGLRGAFRQQILIAEWRLAGLKGKKVAGVHFRRELFDGGALKGGVVDFDVSLSVSTRAPESASEVFANNASIPPVNVFRGTVTVPDSPPLTVTPVPWSPLNSWSIPFSTSVAYSGGTLVVDIAATPKKQGEPDFWYVGHEDVGHDGNASPYGSTCSQFTAGGLSLTAESKGLQIGGTLRVVAFGRAGAHPLLLIGTTPIANGIDLSAMGATGCHQYVSYLVIAALGYQAPIRNMDPVLANFIAQIPPDRNLVGQSVYVQSADRETHLPRAQWTNPAGLTTSNGLQIQLASAPPTLGMSIVVSSEVELGKPMPASGRVDVERAPVLRLLYVE